MSPRPRRPRAASRLRADLGRTALLMIVAALVAAACGNSSVPSTTTSTPAGHTSTSTSAQPAGSFSLHFYDDVASESCTRGSPAGAMCFLLSGHGAAPGFGAVTVGPALDVEVPATSSLCGKPERFLERLAFQKGEVTVRVVRPRLCIGATGPVGGSFVVIVGGRGRGTVMIDVLASGAEEIWKGIITVATPASSSSTSPPCQARPGSNCCGAPSSTSGSVVVTEADNGCTSDPASRQGPTCRASRDTIRAVERPAKLR